MSERNFDPMTDLDVTPLRFYDHHAKRNCIYVYPETKHWTAGWILYQHPDGQFVTLRKATDADIKTMGSAYLCEHGCGRNDCPNCCDPIGASSVPAEAPAPSQTEAGCHEWATAKGIEGCIHCGKPRIVIEGNRKPCPNAPDSTIDHRLRSRLSELSEKIKRAEPQAAQTVASPTRELLREDERVMLESSKLDSTILVGTDIRVLISRLRESRDYAATLEARVAAQKNIIATLGEGKAAAEERAEKAEARVGELEGSLPGRMKGVQAVAEEKCKWFLERAEKAEARLARQSETIQKRQDSWHEMREQRDALAVSLRDVGETLRKRQKLIHDCARRGHGMSVETCKDSGCEEVASLLSRLSTDTKEEKHEQRS